MAQVERSKVEDLEAENEKLNAANLKMASELKMLREEKKNLLEATSVQKEVAMLRDELSELKSKTEARFADAARRDAAEVDGRRTQLRNAESKIVGLEGAIGDLNKGITERDEIISNLLSNLKTDVVELHQKHMHASNNLLERMRLELKCRDNDISHLQDAIYLELFPAIEKQQQSWWSSLTGDDLSFVPCGGGDRGALSDDDGSSPWWLPPSKDNRSTRGRAAPSPTRQAAAAAKHSSSPSSSKKTTRSRSAPSSPASGNK